MKCRRIYPSMLFAEGPARQFQTDDVNSVRAASAASDKFATASVVRGLELWAGQLVELRPTAYRPLSFVLVHVVTVLRSPPLDYLISPLSAPVRLYVRFAGG